MFGIHDLVLDGTIKASWLNKVQVPKYSSYIHVDIAKDVCPIKDIPFPSAPRPKPFETDRAYFSEFPKLFAISKRPGKSLGLSIMTREVSQVEGQLLRLGSKD